MKVRVLEEKQRCSLDCTKRLFCQKLTDEKNVNGITRGKATVLRKLKIRMAGGDGEALELYHDIKDMVKEDEEVMSFKSLDVQLVWHRQCYSNFTNESNIPKPNQLLQTLENTESTAKIMRINFRWKMFCLFCTKKTHKKVKTMIKVSTFTFCTTLEKEVNEKNDEVMRCRVGDFSKLIALEARYHQKCRTDYYNEKPASQSSQSTSHLPYNDALEDMMETVLPDLKNGIAINMNKLLETYQSHLCKYMSQKDSQNYSKHKLKRKII